MQPNWVADAPTVTLIPDGSGTFRGRITVTTAKPLTVTYDSQGRPLCSGRYYAKPGNGGLGKTLLGWALETPTPNIFGTGYLQYSRIEQQAQQIGGQGCAVTDSQLAQTALER